MFEVFRSTFDQINSGGAVMWFLIALSFLIWALIFNYLLALNLDQNGLEQGTYFKDYIDFINNVETKKSSQAIDIITTRISLDEKIIKSLIAVAPLLGLLGTVGGMIETFASLETMEMFKPSGGIAAGVSQALLTTQFGLIVAVPALLFLKYAEKRKNQFLDSVKKVLSERVKLNEI